MKNGAMKALLATVVASLTLLLGACSISVDDKDKKNEKVDIKTPFADLKVDSSGKAADNGIPVYPGAHLRPPDNGDNHSANISMGAAGFGLNVIAAEYETSDSPEKVKAFYEDKMKQFGKVLVCTGHDGGSDIHMSVHNPNGNKELSCDGDRGSGWEVKAGRSNDEHMVSIEASGSGTRFGTVLVQTRGEHDTL